METDRRAESERVGFKPELKSLLNRYSMEGGSDTPDFILAQYLWDCLAAYNRAVNERTEWYGRDARIDGHDAYCEATSSEAFPGYGPCQCAARIDGDG